MPLLKGSSKKVVSQNISEFHTGKTYAQTLRKFGSKKANAQAVAVALSTARKYARKAEGGADLEDPRMKAIGIRPVTETPPAPPISGPPVQPEGSWEYPKPEGSWEPPVASEDDLTKAYLKNLTGTETGEARTPFSKIISAPVQGMVDLVKAPGEMMKGPEQTEHQTPGFETEEEAALQNLNNQSYDRQMTDFGAGMATNVLGISKFFKTPENAVGIGGAKLKTPEPSKFFHPYDLDPAELKGAELKKTNAETGGSNPGGVYQLKDGTPVYVKQFQGENAIERTYNEKLANELLKLADVPVAELKMTKFNGKPALVSYMVPAEELNQIHSSKYDQLEGLRSHYPAHLWTGNYDFVGTGKNNIMVMPNGQTIHIDPGGALRYRAQGALKGPDMWGPNVEHFKMTPGKDLTDVMEGHLDSPALQDSAKRVAAITDEQIHGLVEKYGPLQKGKKAELEETLKARRDGVAKLYGVDKGGSSAPPTGGEPPNGHKLTVVPKGTPAEQAQLASDKASAKFLLKTHGDNVEGIANELWDLAHKIGPKSADGIVKHLPEEMYSDLDAHLDAISDQYGVNPWKPKQEPDIYAMGDDTEPPVGPEGWGHANEDHFGNIKFKDGPHFWDNAPVFDELSHGIASSTEIGRLFDKASKGEPSPFRKIDISKWEPPFAHQIEKPKFENITPEQAKELGFNNQMLLGKGVKSPNKVDHPEYLSNPQDKKSGYLNEHAIYFFPRDNLHPTHAFGSWEAKPYVMSGKNVWEGYYPRLRGESGQPPSGITYSDMLFQNIIKAAHERKIDALILHGVADSGAGNQTQILILNTHGTLRATNAKFQNLTSNKPLDAILAAGSIPVFYQAMKKMGGGDNKDEKMARGGKVKEREPQDHEFINFAKGGMINSDIPGRTDKIPMKVATGAYVLPADIPSALGQGNTIAGKTILDKMFNSGPYGLPLAKGKPAKFQMPHLKGFAEGGPVDSNQPVIKPTGTDNVYTISRGPELNKWDEALIEHGRIRIPKELDEPQKWLEPLRQRMDSDGFDRQDQPDGSVILSRRVPQNVPTSARGGDTDHTPIIAAGGEYVLNPDTVRDIGNGDIGKGHRTLDAFVLHTRREHIKTLRKLKPPK